MKSAGEKSSDSPYICVETVCRTQLGLDVNLITISSSDGILDEEEDRLNQLFPDTNSPRCRKFKDKKASEEDIYVIMGVKSLWFSRWCLYLREFIRVRSVPVLFSVA